MTDNIDISVIIITLGRETLYKTLESLFKQKLDKNFEIILILQGSVDEKRISDMNINHVNLKILSYPYGLGFGKYRNEGILYSKGKIVAFIDDDEWTKDENWLLNLTKPLDSKKYNITTAGYEIPITGKYLTDCISLLGYPGGGALGYEKMWIVNSKGETDHICSGNFAFNKDLEVLFNDNLKYGAEDADFGNRVIREGYTIKYIKEATVYHFPRTGLFSFIRWHIKRGISIYEFKKLGLLDKKLFYDRKRSVINIFKNVLFTKYLFGVVIFFTIQYFTSLFGFLRAVVFNFYNTRNSSIE